MIKYDEVKNLSAKELGLKINQLKKETLTIKLQSSVSGNEKPHKLQLIKKDIARLLTFATQKKNK
jgi:large subunit ribosomal protein L29